MADPQHGPEIFRRIEDHISRMPNQPVTVTRVLDICNNPVASAIEPGRVIALDPVLMGQVPRLVNSACCGLRDTVSTLPRAADELELFCLEDDLMAMGESLSEKIGKARIFLQLARPDVQA